MGLRYEWGVWVLLFCLLCLLLCLNSPKNSREFEVMFSEADKNDDGKIDFDEFVAMMLPTATNLSP